MKKKTKHSFLYANGLSIVVLTIMVILIAGQFFTGMKEYNSERKERGESNVTSSKYFQSGHFIETTFENWESEFLQMSVYVLLTIFLRQKGSSESKKLDEKEEVDREPKPGKSAPWAVNKGGIWLKLYSHSLSAAFAILFLISFILHFYGSRMDYNEEQVAKGLSAESFTEYLSNSRFWFESFQNWQSEFLAVAAIVLMSIYLREKGSPESKPVDAPHFETGG